MIYTSQLIKDEVVNAVINGLWDTTGKDLVYEDDTTFRFDISQSNATILKAELGDGFTQVATVYGEEVAIYCMCRFDGNWATVLVDTLFMN